VKPPGTAPYSGTPRNFSKNIPWKNKPLPITTYDALDRPLTVRNGAGAFVNVVIEGGVRGGMALTVRNGAGAFVNGVFTIANPLSSCTFTYDPDNLALATETVSHDLDTDGTPELTRVIARTRDTLNRDSGWQLKAGTTVENEAAYG
jgi:hypothetical protein